MNALKELDLLNNRANFDRLDELSRSKTVAPDRLDILLGEITFLTRLQTNHLTKLFRPGRKCIDQLVKLLSDCFLHNRAHSFSHLHLL